MYLPEWTVLIVHCYSDVHQGLAHYQEIPSPSIKDRGGKKSFQKKRQTQSISLFHFLGGSKSEIMLNAYSFHMTIRSLGKDKSKFKTVNVSAK